MLVMGAVCLSIALAGQLARAAAPKAVDWLKPYDGFVCPVVGFLLALAGICGLTRPAGLPRRAAPAHEPWRAFPGGPTHLLDETGRRALRTLGRGGWLSLLAVGLAAWVLLLPARAGTFFVGVGAGVSTLGALGVLVYGLVLLARFRRFGSARLRLSRFPFYLGEPMQARFRAGRPLPADGPLRVTLRCVEETYEMSRGSDGATHSTDTSVARHEETRTVEPKELEAGGREFDVRFVPPAGAPPTKLTISLPTYWELVVRVERPGMDYAAVFLLPLYARGG